MKCVFIFEKLFHFRKSYKFVFFSEVKMAKKEALTALIDAKKAAILQVLLNSPEELYLKEIAQKSNVPIASAYRIILELVRLKILQRREWKNSKVYTACQNEHVQFLKELFHEEIDGITEFVKATEGIIGIKHIIQYGGKNKGKANLLVIGETIDTSKIDEICSQLKHNGFELSCLTLGEKQYEQMIKMGLYSGEKQILK